MGSAPALGAAVRRARTAHRGRCAGREGGPARWLRRSTIGPAVDATRRPESDRQHSYPTAPVAIRTRAASRDPDRGDHGADADVATSRRSVGSDSPSTRPSECRASSARGAPTPLVQRRGQPAARVARERVLDAELVERARRRRGAGRPCGRRRDGSASMSRSMARSGRRRRAPRSASSRSRSPASSRRMRAARPSAWKPRERSASSAAPPRASPRRCRSRASAVGGVGAGRVELERAAQRRLVARGHERVGLAGDERVEEALDLRGRLRADELVDDPAVLERLDGGDALDAERLRDARVGVGVELGEDDVALARGGGLLEERARARGTARTTRPRSRRRPGSCFERSTTSCSKSCSVTSMTVMLLG